MMSGSQRGERLEVDLAVDLAERREVVGVGEADRRVGGAVGPPQRAEHAVDPMPYSQRPPAATLCAAIESGTSEQGVGDALVVGERPAAAGRFRGSAASLPPASDDPEQLVPISPSRARARARATVAEAVAVASVIRRPRGRAAGCRRGASTG